MFGYVSILKDELKIKDYNIFRAYYCGLCKALGKRSGQITRLGLSYDMTFLLIIISAVKDIEPEFSRQRCIAHPTAKHLTLKDNSLTAYVADVSCMLAYLKCADDFSDERSIKGLIGMAVYMPCVRKIRTLRNDIYSHITIQLKRLSALEAGHCSDIDLTADCFAKITELLFAYNSDGDEKRKLGWLGYNLGRWIYIIDAFSDIRSDFKSKSYNPFLCKKPSYVSVDDYIKSTAEALDASMTFNLSNIASAYELLGIKRNDAILRNILYEGLLFKQKKILNINGETPMKGITDNESI